jgi:2-aminoadipate transaminase
MNQTVTSVGPSRAVGRISSSAIRELLALVDRPDVISLAGGLPSAAHFPVERTRLVVDEMLRGDPGVLQYSSTEGHRELREWIAARHGVGADQVVVTHGSQQALDLIGRATVEIDDPVVLADPGYVGAIQAMRLSGGYLVGLPTDGEGLCVEVLEERLVGGLRPKLVYVVPNFHNPTGATLSAARAERLAGLAERFGFLIVEDDPYGEIRFCGRPPPALATLTERVMSIGTISKVLFPGLRVGWIVAPGWLAPALALVKQAVDLHTSTLAQEIAFRLLTGPGFLADHLAGLRAHYESQAECLAGALAGHFGDELEMVRPEGGLFLWARLRRPGTDTDALLPRAIGQGVAYVPGSAFSVGAPHRDSLRLSYATVPAGELVEGAHRLAGVLLDRPGETGPRGRRATGPGPT